MIPNESVPQYGTVAMNSTGLTTIAPAVTGRSIYATNYLLSGAGAASFRWFSGTVTAISGTLSFASGTGHRGEYSPLGHFKTAAGEALVGSVSAANNVFGHITYVYGD